MYYDFTMPRASLIRAQAAAHDLQLETTKLPCARSNVQGE